MRILFCLLIAQWPATLEPQRGTSSGLPFALSAGVDCQRGPELHVCAQEGRVVWGARAHQEPVSAKGPIQWLRVSGLEWQAYYVESIAQVEVQGQVVEVQRLGHPNAPHDGWELAGWSPAPASGERVGRASLSKSPLLHGESRAEAAMTGCPLVELERFPVALLFDDQGALRMLRLQGLPEQPLAELELACVASAMEGLQVVPGTKVVELQLTLR